jgi:two-component system, sporulation sensor kinase E
MMSTLAHKLSSLKVGPIPLMLIICFGLLLILIWLIGSLGQRKLKVIQTSANESALAYTRRLKLAIDIREAAANVMGVARVYRASRGLEIRGPVFKLALNEAKKKLDEKLEEGDSTWSIYKGTLPPEEIKAWEKLQSATQEFWRAIEEEEKPQTPISDLTEQASDATNADNTGLHFFLVRTNLRNAAEELSSAIDDGLRMSQDRIVELQAKAADEVDSAKIVTLFMAIIVIAITIWLMRKYINQIKQEERLKQEAQGRLRSVFDSLSNNIVVVSEQGAVLEVNQAFLEHYKLSDAELRLQDYRTALAQTPEIASFVGGTLQKRSFEQRQRERIEVKSENGRPDSSLFDVSVSPLKVGDKTHGRVVVMDDVTEEERVREELRRSRTLSAVGQITAQVAHEIYNPLGAVKLNLELLEMQAGEDEDVKHTIGRLKRGVEHLSTIALDLRFLTRPREPERRPTDLNELLDEVVELASDRVARSRVRIVRNYSAELPRGQFDPQLLRKVFLNLLINAVDASPQQGDVELSTYLLPKHVVETIPDFSSPNGAIEVSVIDRGVGMSAETKRRLFEAFFTTKHNGTGLGMMITQEIVKKHGGKIEVESEEGEGTKVCVYLPI